AQSTSRTFWIVSSELSAWANDNFRTDCNKPAIWAGIEPGHLAGGGDPGADRSILLHCRDRITRRCSGDRHIDHHRDTRCTDGDTADRSQSYGAQASEGSSVIG